MSLSLKHSGSEIFIPDGAAETDALRRAEFMGIAAHPDDLEIMAYHGILTSFGKKCFFGVILTDGAGSPRDGFYKKFSDAEMQAVRRMEQRKAAVVGEYSGVAFLNYSSSALKDPKNGDPVEDLAAILRAARPKTVYTHNPADKHDTHVAGCLRTIEAIRRMSEAERPERLFGCEVWRDLDWLGDEDKVGFDVSDHQNLATALVAVYDSQVAGGKGYDLATIGRRRAHATYYASHDVDKATSMIYAMDLTLLVKDPAADVASFVDRHIQRFAADVRKRIEKLR